MCKNIVILFISVISLTLAHGDSSNSLLSGNANFYFISKMENGDIINLPYRMINASWINQHDNFELVSSMSLEYKPTLNNYSFSKDDPQDFLFDLRELYLTWYTNFGEIRIGKQIQSWGFVDENSPLDNSCAYDYNYLFEAGSERKIASTSLAADVYYKNLKFGFTTSPFHQINRLPSDNADFPIELPVTPRDYQFMDVVDVNEYGAYAQFSTDYLDVGLSYFSGYDRIFNLSGINLPKSAEDKYYVIVTTDSLGNIVTDSDGVPYGTVVEDTVFSYRNTEVLGVSGVLLIADLTLRADVGYFTTQDVQDDISRPYYDPPNWPILDMSFLETYPTKESAEYYQSTIQIEYQLPNNLDLLCQYFKHEMLSYSSDTPIPEGDPIYVPDYNATVEGFDPKNYFYPGMGSPLALISENAVLLGINKSFYNGKVDVQLSNLIDLDYKGYFVELNTEYRLTDQIKTTFAVNYVEGDENHPRSQSKMGEDYQKALDYPLNQMKDFSHFRMQIKYSF